MRRCIFIVVKYFALQSYLVFLAIPLRFISPFIRFAVNYINVQWDYIVYTVWGLTSVQKKEKRENIDRRWGLRIIRGFSFLKKYTHEISGTRRRKIRDWSVTELFVMD